MDLGWGQARLGRFLNVRKGTVANWELGHQSPLVRHWPRIIEFLGYNPEPEADGLGGRLRQ